jgi:hypothetical protein
MQFIKKTAEMSYGRLLQDTAHMKSDVMSAMQFTAETWKLTTSVTLENCFTNYGFQLVMSTAMMIMHYN